MNLHGTQVMMFVAASVLSLAILTTAFTQNGDQELKEGELHVGEGYEFPSVQIAIDSAAEGSTIVVHSGEYHERLFIYRGITLKAAPGESFHLAASSDDPGPPGTRGAALIITSSSPVTINGGTYSYSGGTWNDAAIKIQYGYGHTIQNANIKDSKQGIWVHGGDLRTSLSCGNIRISGNTIQNISGHGIYLQRSYANIYGNTISLCGEGIMVAHGYTSSGGGIWGNEIHNSTVGVFLESDWVPKLDQNTFFDCQWGVYLNDTSSPLTLNNNDYYRCSVGMFYRGSNGPILDQEVYYNCTTALHTGAAGGGKLIVRSCEIYGSEGYSINLTTQIDARGLRVVGAGGTLFKLGNNGDISIHDSYLETSRESLRAIGTGSITMMNTTLSSLSRSFVSEDSVLVELSQCNFTSRENSFVMEGGGSLHSANSDFTSTSGRALKLSNLTRSYLQGGGAFSDGAQVIYLFRCVDFNLNNVKITGSNGAGLFLKESQRVLTSYLRIDGNLSEGIIITGEGQDFLRHTIGETNTFGGKPIYYIYGESGGVFNLTDKGEVIIAGTTDAVIREVGCSPGSTWVLGSQNVTFLNSTLEQGLHTIDSSDINGENLLLRPSSYSGVSLLMENSTLHLFNSTLFEGIGSSETFYLSRSSRAHFYNTTFSGYGYIDSSTLTTYHLIGLKVLFSDDVAAPGVEYLLSLDNSTFRATALFSGTSPPTDENGTAGPWWIPHITYDDSSLTKHLFTITVNATVDRSWQEERSVNTSFDHIEVFRTSDIRAPAIPSGVEAHPVEGGDEILITWKDNEDDTDLYRVYLVGNTLQLLGESTSASFRDVGVENGTSRTYRVSAVDEEGIESDLSPPVTAIARDYVPPERPSSLWVVGYGGINATLLWSESSSEDVVIYRIFVAMGRRGGGGIEGFLLAGETTDNTFEVFDLLPETEYTLTVLAYDEASNPSLPAPMAYITTPDITWPVVSNLTWKVDLYQVTVEWDTDQVTQGTLHLGTSTENMQEYSEEEYSLHHTIFVDRLAHNATYYFWVYSEEPSGNSVADDNGGNFYTFKTPPFEGYLRIEILSSRDGTFITGAAVRASGRSAQMGLTEISPGVYSGTLEPGPWTISVNADGFVSPSPFDVEVKILKWTNLTLNMTPAGPPLCNLSIRIVDKDGRGIEGASLTFEGMEYTSDEDGWVHLGYVPSNATYTLTVEGEGYNKRSVKVEIPYGEEEVEEKITLKKEGGGSLLWLAVLLIALVGALGAVFYMRSRGKGEAKAKERPPEEEPEVKSGKV